MRFFVKIGPTMVIVNEAESAEAAVDIAARNSAVIGGDDVEALVWELDEPRVFNVQPRWLIEAVDPGEPPLRVIS